MAGVGKVTLTNIDLRENFRVAAIMIAHANHVDVSKVDMNQLVQGYIQSFIDATVGQSQLQFPITNTDLTLVGAPNIPMMRIVNQVDSFVAGKMGYYLMSYIFDNAKGQTSPDFTSAFSFMSPITYPSIYQGGSSITGLSAGIIMFWLGYISIEVNGIKLYKNWECMQHLYIPQNQTPATLPAALTSPGPDNPFALGPGGQLPYWQPNMWDPFDGGNDAFYPLEPLPVFSGSKQNIVLLNLPANIPATIRPFNNGSYGVGNILKCVVHYRGVLAQNSTSMK